MELVLVRALDDTRTAEKGGRYRLPGGPGIVCMSAVVLVAKSTDRRHRAGSFFHRPASGRSTSVMARAALAKAARGVVVRDPHHTSCRGTGNVVGGMYRKVLVLAAGRRARRHRRGHGCRSTALRSAPPAHSTGARIKACWSWPPSPRRQNRSRHRLASAALCACLIQCW